jgi:hypothetical protein
VPKLPRQLATSLAAASDGVAAKLDAGDACGAAADAQALQERTIRSMVGVPADLQEPLQSAVNDLAGRTSSACMAAQAKQPPPAPPPPAPVEAPPNLPPGLAKKHGKGHGKGHEKRKKHGGDEGGGD